jgi:phage terminase large subunit-like protein
MTDMVSVLAALYLRSLLFFAERAMTVIEPGTELEINWHHQAIAYQLERSYRGENRRLIINQPPKTLKTHLVSVAYVAWLLLHDPSLRIAIICYDEALASTQLRKVRQVMKSHWYRRLGPKTRIRKEKDSETLFETTAGGEVRALSVQGGITGHGFDFIIIDDPQKAGLAHSETERRNLEELYSSAIANRWRKPTIGVLIVVMQRLHVDDFTAFLLRVPGDKIHLSIPAIAPCDMRFAVGEDRESLFEEGALLEPDRLPQEALDEMRALQGEVHYMAQYMQAPVATGGHVIDRTWFHNLIEIRKFEARVISIDPAFTENGGNFSAALVCDFVGDDLQLVHGEQVQHDYPQLIRWIRQLDKRWSPDVFLVEAIGAGLALRHYLSDFGIDHVATIETHGGRSKLRRMEMVSPKIEAGRVWLPSNADWARQFLNLIAAFPYGPSDDWPDALSQVLFWQERVCRMAMHHRLRRFPPEPPPNPYPVRRGGMHYRRVELTW